MDHFFGRLNMNELQQRIEKLTREEVFEAAQFIAQEISEGRLPEEREDEVLKEITEKPFENIDEFENMARILLSVAAETPDLQDKVEQAIAGIGKKQLILGGAEIIMLAGLFLVGLHIVISRGVSSVSEKTEYEEKNGKSYVRINKKTTYGISSVLGNIFKSYFK